MLRNYCKPCLLELFLLTDEINDCNEFNYLTVILTVSGKIFRTDINETR